MRKTGLLPFFLLLLTPGLAGAQSAAGGLYGIRQVVVQYPRFADQKAAESCGLTREAVTGALVKALKAANVPAVPANEAPPMMMGAARVDLVTDIYSSNSQGLDCLSVFNLAAESRANVVIPPVNVPRGVTISYWKQSNMLSSGQSQHGQLAADLLQKIADKFAQQYRTDQPQP
jgi:hypothetical protein